MEEDSFRWPLPVQFLWGHLAILLAIVAIVLVVLMLAAAVLFPRSRRWARLNRLHRLASRNDRALRRDARESLDEALRALDGARRRCLASERAGDAEQIGQLARHLAMIRDRVASDYVPSPANARARGDWPDLGRLDATEHLSELCVVLARQVRRAPALEPRRLEEATEAALKLEEEVSR